MLLQYLKSYNRENEGAFTTFGQRRALRGFLDAVEVHIDQRQSSNTSSAISLIDEFGAGICDVVVHLIDFAEHLTSSLHGEKEQTSEETAIPAFDLLRKLLLVLEFIVTEANINELLISNLESDLVLIRYCRFNYFQ